MNISYRIICSQTPMWTDAQFCSQDYSWIHNTNYNNLLEGCICGRVRNVSVLSGQMPQFSGTLQFGNWGLANHCTRQRTQWNVPLQKDHKDTKLKYWSMEQNLIKSLPIRSMVRGRSWWGCTQTAKTVIKCFPIGCHNHIGFTCRRFRLHSQASQAINCFHQILNPLDLQIKPSLSVW
jgi:hypothetical protein